VDTIILLDRVDRGSLCTDNSYIVIEVSHVSNRSETVPLLAMPAPRGERRYSSYSLTSTQDGVSGQRHAQLRFTPGEEHQYPLDRELSRPQSWSGHRIK
jgi:hypothetical protein